MKEMALSFPLVAWRPGRRSVIMAVGVSQNREKDFQAEQKLFWELVEPLQKKLYNFIHKSLRFSEESRDLFQDVLTRAFQYFPGYDRQRSFPGWIFAIAHNEIKRHFKKQRAKNDCLPLDDMAAWLPAAETDPKVLAVYQVAVLLPLKSREVFFLYYYNRFAVEEISVMTGLRPGNVKFILHQARETIKTFLEVRRERCRS